MPSGELLSLIVAGAVSSAATWLLVRFGERLPHDAPNARSLHAAPVPRVGGLGILTGLACAAGLGAIALPGGALTLAAVAAMLAVSLADDIRGVHPAPRLAVHMLASGTAAFALLRASAPSMAAAGDAGLVGFVVLVLAWSANAFNFMDGSDGLAGAMAAVGFAAYALGTPTTELAVLYWTVVVAVLPFLAVNLPPARAFMGDCGAVPLGFLAGVCGAGEWLAGAAPGWFAPLVFLPFLADATLTLVRRLARRERVWRAHKEHFYQRLNQLGAGHRGTLATYAMLMAGTAASAVVTRRMAPAAGWLVLAAWCAAFAMLFLAIDYHWRRRQPLTQ